jgi:drug/metabolite transporter (DMT)-like permease
MTTPKAQVSASTLPLRLQVRRLVGERDALHLVGMISQASIIVTGGFISWLWLLSVYPAATVASFSFLTPLLSVCLGWALFGESLSLSFLLAAGMVATGIVLLNRRTA